MTTALRIKVAVTVLGAIGLMVGAGLPLTGRAQLGFGVWMISAAMFIGGAMTQERADLNEYEELKRMAGDHIDRARSLEAALEEIAAILGTGKCGGGNCEGCQYEHEAAAAIARKALEGSIPPIPA